MQLGEKKTTTATDSIVSSALNKKTTAIFESAFDFYGTLDNRGRIESLSGRIFDKTNANAELLRGQSFAETVFWQSSENTARLVEKAVADAARGEQSTLL